MNLEETKLRERVRVLEEALLTACDALDEIRRSTEEGPTAAFAKRWCETGRAALVPPAERCRCAAPNLTPGSRLCINCKHLVSPPAETPAPTARRDRFEKYEDPVTGETLYRVKAKTPAPFHTTCSNPNCPAPEHQVPVAAEDRYDQPVARDESVSTSTGVQLSKSAIVEMSREEIDRLRVELAAEKKRADKTQWIADARLREINGLNSQLAAANDEIVHAKAAYRGAEKVIKMRDEAHAATTAKLGQAVAALQKAAVFIRNCHEREIIADTKFAHEIAAILADDDSKTAGEAWAEMVAVLEWYAHKHHYARGAGLNIVEDDRGQRAREALAKVDARRGKVKP